LQFSFWDYFLHTSQKISLNLSHIKYSFQIKNQSVIIKVIVVIWDRCNSSKIVGSKNFLILTINTIIKIVVISVVFTTFSVSLSHFIVLSFLKTKDIANQSKINKI